MAVLPTTHCLYYLIQYHATSCGANDGSYVVGSSISALLLEAQLIVLLLKYILLICFNLLVDIGIGVPDDKDKKEEVRDILLGDVVVSKQTGGFGGTVQYDLARYVLDDGFEK